MSDDDNQPNPFIQTPSSHYKKHRFNPGEFFKSISVILIVVALFYAVFALRYDSMLTKNAYIIGGAPAQAPAQSSPTPPPEEAQGGGDQGGDSNSPLVNPPVEAPYVPSGGGSSTQICAPCIYDGVCQACCSSDQDCPIDQNAAAQTLKDKARNLAGEVVLKIKQVLTPKIVFSTNVPSATASDGLGVSPIDVKRMLTVVASQTTATGFSSRVELKAVNKGTTNVPTLVLQEKITAIDYAGSSYRDYPNAVFKPRPSRIEEGSVIVTWLFENVGPQEEVTASYEIDGKLSKDDLNNMQAPRVITNLQSGEDAPAYGGNSVRVQPNNVAPSIPPVKAVSTTQQESNINLVLLLSLLLALDVAAYYYMKNKN